MEVRQKVVNIWIFVFPANVATSLNFWYWETVPFILIKSKALLRKFSKFYASKTSFTIVFYLITCAKIQIGLTIARPRQFVTRLTIVKLLTRTLSTYILCGLINIFTPLWKISQPTRAPTNALHCSLPQRNKFWFMIWDNKVTTMHYSCFKWKMIIIIIFAFCISALRIDWLG